MWHVRLRGDADLRKQLRDAAFSPGTDLGNRAPAVARGLYAWLTELPPREDALAAMIIISNVSPELA